jgi:capsule polysaccharide export protein KpsE/RkpR
MKTTLEAKVATLTAAIQELKAINDTQAGTINALTARIVALENR